MVEFAPGIPATRAIDPLPTVDRPRTWELALQRHEARRSGVHLDLRLVDGPRAHSWALRSWPTPGQIVLAVRQPTHTRDYALGFEGRIESGYGAGQVTMVRREKAEILDADDAHVRFNLYPGARVEEYLLKHTTDANWILRQITPQRQARHIPDRKPAYKETRPEKLDPADPKTVWQAKIDGAHVLLDLGSSHPRVFSYRPGKKSELINHTPRLKSLLTVDTPPALRGALLRAELGAVDADGHALPAAQIGGLLNAGVWKSRERQKELGARPLLYSLDVVRWRGKNVENAPYAEKARMLDEARVHAPWLRKPPTATTVGAKEALRRAIDEGREKSTVEGLVEWHADKSVPTKAKFFPERDVFVRRVFAENTPSSSMSFPNSEIPDLKLQVANGQKVVTTRIDNELGRWRQGQIVTTPMGVMRVNSVRRVNDVKEHPYHEHLTRAQAQTLTDKKMDVVELTAARAGLAGGFEYALTPKGPVAGRVGTGLSHDLKKHMLQNPGLYEGLRAKIRTQRAPEAYAPRAAVFAGWHLDQTLPEGIKTADVDIASRVRALKAKLRPGDIINTNPRVVGFGNEDFDPVFKPVSILAQGTRFGHSAFYEGQGNVIEARAGMGVFRRPLAALAAKHQLVAVRPEAGADERRDAITYMRQQLGKKFSETALVLRGLKPDFLSRVHVPGRKDIDDRRFCSNLIANAYHRIPFNRERAIEDTRPVDILDSPRTQVVGQVT